MAKTIKFNLRLNESSIRNIDDLKENFVVEEILKYYRENLLFRWLKVRGYDDYAEKVEEIKMGDDFAIAKELVKIFEIEKNDAEIESSLYSIKFFEEEKILNEEYKKNNFEKQQIVEDYLTGYNEAFQKIEENKDNLQVIRKIVEEIENSYKDLFFMDRYIFKRIKDLGIKTIIAILMNENLRKIVEEIQIIKEKLVEDFKNLYINDIKDLFGTDLKGFNGNIDFWQDLEEKDKKIMIIASVNCLVREPNNRQEVFKSEDIKNTFKIFNGLDIQSEENKNCFIFYLEV